MDIGRKITIEFYLEGEDKLTPEQIDEIEETAKVDICDFIKDGYTSGELNSNYDHTGWWSLTTEIN